MKRITLVLTVLLWAVAGYAVAQDYDGSTGIFQSALENNRTNQASTWVNPDTGGSGTVVPVRTFQNAQGLPCREFQQTIVIGGREEQGYGTACRQPDGTWSIVSPQPAAAPVEQRTTVYVREVPRVVYYDPYPSYYYPSYPSGYYAPRGYGYPYWYPFSFSLSLGYVDYGGGRHHGGHHYGGHHGGHRR